MARVKYLSEPEDGKTGKYFYVDLCDSTGEIRAIAFNLEAYRFHSIFKVILFFIDIILYL